MNGRKVSNSGHITRLIVTVFFMSYGWCAVASIPRTLRRQSKSDPWLVVQDKTGACRMSVPPDWKLQPRWPGHVIAPEQTETTLTAGTRRIRVAMSDADQKAFEVGRLFENSPDFWFYSSKPISGSGGKPNLIVYHVNVVRDEGSCIAQILVNQSHPEDEIRKIALSVKAVHTASVSSRRLDVALASGASVFLSHVAPNAVLQLDGQEHAKLTTFTQPGFGSPSSFQLSRSPGPTRDTISDIAVIAVDQSSGKVRVNFAPALVKCRCSSRRNRSRARLVYLKLT